MTNQHQQPPRGGEEQMTTQPEQDQPPGHDTRIYVASLSDYNNGHLHGQWINTDQDEQQMAADVDAMLQRSPAAKLSGEPAEEWAIHDHDGFRPINVSEHESLAAIAKYTQGIGDHGQAFAHWVAMLGSLDDREVEGFEDDFLGEWKSVAAYAEHILDDLGYTEQITAAIPEHLRHYVTIDSSGFGRDLILGGEIYGSETRDGTVHLFDARR